MNSVDGSVDAKYKQYNVQRSMKEANKEFVKYINNVVMDALNAVSAISAMVEFSRFTASGGAGAEAAVTPARCKEDEKSIVRMRGILDVSPPAQTAIVIKVLDGEQLSAGDPSGCFHH